MNKLRSLNVSYNKIESFEDVKIEFTPNIQVLEIQGNKIYFDSQMEFEDFVLIL